MVRIKPNWGTWWPDDATHLEASDVIGMYKQGFVGAFQDPEAKERLDDHIRSMGDDPDGGNVAHRYGFTESGAGKLTLLFPAVTKFYGYEALSKPAQGTGDCLLSSAEIAMADGSRKSICDVKVGEYVVSAAGRNRRVTRTIEKPYRGDLVEITGHKQFRPLIATPDHLVLSFRGDEATPSWRRIGEIIAGDRLYTPSPVDESDASCRIFDMADYCSTGAVMPSNVWGEKVRRANGGVYVKRLETPREGTVRSKGSKVDVNRFVQMSEDVAWLIGLYAAEGSMDYAGGSPRRITLNIGLHRRVNADTAKRLIDSVFGVNSKVSSVPSKPHVVYVRLACMPVAAFFSEMCPGNVYNKSISKEIMKAPAKVRLACLRGWLDGDGSVGDSQAVDGCSSSFELAMAMKNIALSCGLNPRCSIRPPCGHSKTNYHISFSSSDAAKIYCGIHAPIRAGREPVFITKSNVDQKNLVVDNGVAPLVTDVSRVHHDGYVYCLEVDQDASFISDGYAVHNCVSMAGRDVSLYLVCVDALSGTPDEETGRVEDVPQVSETARNNGVFANEGIYLHRGHNGQGMSCDQGLHWIMTAGGVVIRQKYDQANLEAYNVNFELRGSSGSPSWLNEIGKKHQVRKATRPQTHEQARDYLAIGCPLWICSDLGFSDVRDANGYSRRSGSWAHSWHIVGYDDRPWTRETYGFPLALFGHRWGRWNSGPRRIHGTDIDIPEGYAWIDARLLNQCWMAAVNSVNGWPKRDLPDYGFSVLG